MESLKDFLYTMHSCNNCGQCKWLLGPKMRGHRYAQVCPIHQKYGFDAYSGQGLINIAQEMLEGRLKYEPGLIDLIFTCLTCGACDVNCKSVRDMEVLDTIMALRVQCVEDGQGLQAHREIAGIIESTNNIYGRSHKKRFDWIPEGRKLATDSGMAYFAGCAAAYKYQDISLNTLKILDTSGIQCRILSAEEYCCGNILWRTGQIEAFREAIERNIAAWRNQGIKTIITACAECYGTFRGGYPRYADMDIEVLHITEVVQGALKDGRLKPKRRNNIKVTYHDPCFLGRLSEKYVPWHGKIEAYGVHVPPKTWRRGEHGIYEAPREILKSIPGIELKEMARNAENSFCCGGGGGVPVAFPDFAKWTAEERMGEVIASGAEAIVSACPFCRDSLTDNKANSSKLQYYDITGLLAEAL